MIADRLEGKWIDLFAEVFAQCKVAPGDACAILSETQSRALNVQLAELALHRLGARPFHVVVPTPAQRAPVPIRSTGASVALQGLGPALQALAASTFVADCTLEGLMHAAELPGDPQGRCARALHLERAPGSARAPRPLPRGRAAGEGGDAPAARGEGNEGLLARRHRLVDPRGRRARRRRLGLHREAGHALALARRALPVLSAGRQRQRHAGHGARAT